MEIIAIVLLALVIILLGCCCILASSINELETKELKTAKETAQIKEQVESFRKQRDELRKKLFDSIEENAKSLNRVLWYQQRNRSLVSRLNKFAIDQENLLNGFRFDEILAEAGEPLESEAVSTDEDDEPDLGMILPFPTDNQVAAQQI